MTFTFWFWTLIIADTPPHRQHRSLCPTRLFLTFTVPPPFPAPLTFSPTSPPGKETTPAPKSVEGDNRWGVDWYRRVADLGLQNRSGEVISITLLYRLYIWIDCESYLLINQNLINGTYRAVVSSCFTDQHANYCSRGLEADRSCWSGYVVGNLTLWTLPLSFVFTERTRYHLTLASSLKNLLADSNRAGREKQLRKFLPRDEWVAAPAR